MEDKNIILAKIQDLKNQKKELQKSINVLYGELYTPDTPVEILITTWSYPANTKGVIHTENLTPDLFSVKFEDGMIMDFHTDYLRLYAQE